MTGEPNTVGGRYELSDLLGRGGMAEVRRAQDTRLGRPVAVKQLRIDLAGDPTFQARFRREAQASAGLNHPNIVAVYDTGEEPDPVTGVQVPYIVMELVEGKTLREVLRDGRKIMPERALELTAGILDALSYSHRAGIVHRDIKPANVMLTPTGSVKVMDFGIARAVADTSSTMTQTAAVIGTAQYLSPEQARGETVDTRSDLYSAGCLLYELLTGRPPFIGDSPVSVAYQHVREQPVPPSELDSMVTPDINAITLKALAKSPDDRYQTAREMKNDINRLLSGQSVTAVIPTPAAPPAPTQVVPTAVPAADPEPTWQNVINTTDEPDRRRRSKGPVVALILLIVIALAAVLTLGGWFYLNNRANQGTVLTPTATPVDVRVVPDLYGYTESDARSAVTAEGFKIKVDTVTGPEDSTVGTVTKQSPDAKARAAVGSTISITVNGGAKMGTIPLNLKGKSLSDVQKALKDAGFTNVSPEKSSDEPATARKDEVLNVSPDEGSKVPLETRIQVVYATGQVDVPDWSGLTEQGVRSDADNKGLKVTFDEQETSDADPGTVIATNPQAGTTVDRGSTVKVTLAKSPKPSHSQQPKPSKSNPPKPSKSNPPKPSKSQSATPSKSQSATPSKSQSASAPPSGSTSPSASDSHS